MLWKLILLFHLHENYSSMHWWKWQNLWRGCYFNNRRSLSANVYLFSRGDNMCRIWMSANTKWVQSYRISKTDVLPRMDLRGTYVTIMWMFVCPFVLFFLPHLSLLTVASPRHCPSQLEAVSPELHLSEQFSIPFSNQELHFSWKHVWRRYCLLKTPRLIKL